MNIEKHNIPVLRYRDKDENPTCAINIQRGEYCIFERTSNFGQVSRCGVTDAVIERRMVNNAPTGSLIPCEDCIVWTDR
jgi:hypothetical protein